jgi:O-antigen ligase
VTAAIVATAGFLLLLTRIIGARQMMLAVMLLRPSCDRVFDWLKTSFDQQSGPGAAVNLLMIALAILALVRCPAVAVSAPLLAWAGFLGSAAFSLLYTTEPTAGVRDFLTLATYAAVFILPYAIITSRRMLGQCLAVALGSSVIPSALALLELAVQPAIVTGDDRLQSTFTHPNIFAFYIMGVISVILFLHRSTIVRLSPLMRRATFAYMGYLVFLLLLTKTRSAWLATALIMAGYAVIVDRRWLAPVLCLPFILLVPAVGERLSDLQIGTIDAGFEHLNSMAWREVLWKATREWLADNPSGLAGYGLAAYQSYVPLFFPRGEGQEGIGPHNAFLQIYFEMGAVGLASFVLLLATVAYQLLSMLRRDFAGSATMLLMCAGYVIICYSDNLLDYLQFQWFFWFVLGSICASTRFSDDGPEGERDIH